MMRRLAALSLAGFALTMLFLAATGRGTEGWFFVLVVWMVLVFVPLWLVVAAFESIGPALRGRAAQRLRTRQEGYGSASEASVLVEDVFAREVVMPRIATPLQVKRAQEAAVALLLLARRHPLRQEALQRALDRCLGCLEAWTRDLGGWAATSAAGDIQGRWAAVRALSALAALSRVLVALCEDRSGRSWPGPGGSTSRAFLDAILDYCDELALQVDVVPWAEPPLRLNTDPQYVEQLRRAWQGYASAPQPSPAALQAFLSAALPGMAF
ncbi:MAG: hypothetical protein RB148_02420 [Armatimonadota bacterium]|nr:hypothetical protein [Armatimonadota bacterium]MDR7428287.1 hypothetical protein [Armatimonadota bacterium]MDR7474787.1 hypothetical protein [Armatimonadota bacterium]